MNAPQEVESWGYFNTSASFTIAGLTAFLAKKNVLVIQHLAIVVFCVPLAVLPPHDVLMAHHGRCEAKQQSNRKVKQKQKEQKCKNIY